MQKNYPTNISRSRKGSNRWRVSRSAKTATKVATTRLTIAFIVLSLAALSCNAIAALSSTATSVPPTLLPADATSSPTQSVPNPTSAPPQTANTPAGPAGNQAPDESILISIGNGSSIVSPVTISGASDPTFENNLLVQILDEGGNVIGSGNALISADIGQRGPFAGTVEFTAPAAPAPGRIVVSSSSARDGHLIHLSSVEVQLLPSGAADIKPAPEHPEAIAILAPALSDVISNGSVSVHGTAGPVFEQSLSVNVLDAGGAVVGSGPLTIQAEVGKPGKFAGEVSYTVTGEQPGSIQVFATSARDGGIIHLSSVEVTLRP